MGVLATAAMVVATAAMVVVVMADTAVDMAVATADTAVATAVEAAAVEATTEVVKTILDVRDPNIVQFYRLTSLKLAEHSPVPRSITSVCRTLTFTGRGGRIMTMVSHQKKKEPAR